MADGSSAASSTGRPTKDRRCPFCDQSFTSSCLGRHLDLYIRDKNPKAPDGVHDVEGIRKLRGHITRRQARNPRRREGSTTSSSKATPLRRQRSPLQSTNDANGEHNESEPFRTFVNRVNWQATGVINNLPATSRSEPTIWGTRREPTSEDPVKEKHSKRQEYVDAIHQGRAAAFEEVLKDLEAASRRAHPLTPFDFNFFSLTLPQLYLRCLVPPPTLLVEPSQRPHELAWSLDPPSAERCELLRGWLSSKLSDWRRRRDYAPSDNSCLPERSNGLHNSHSEAEVVKQEEASYYEHIDTAFKKWTELTNRQRQETWHYDCATAFAREHEKHQATLKRLSQAEQEIEQLRVQLEQSVQGHLLSEASRYSATNISISREAISHLPESTTREYNGLVSKWRKRLQSVRSTTHRMPAHDWERSAPRPDHANGHGPPSATHLRDNWPSQDGEPDASGDEDQELCDAPGEEDPDSADIADHNTFHDDTYLDPNLREGVKHRSSKGG